MLRFVYTIHPCFVQANNNLAIFGQNPDWGLSRNLPTNVVLNESGATMSSSLKSLLPLGRETLTLDGAGNKERQADIRQFDVKHVNVCILGMVSRLALVKAILVKDVCSYDRIN